MDQSASATKMTKRRATYDVAFKLSVVKCAKQTCKGAATCNALSFSVHNRLDCFGISVRGRGIYSSISAHVIYFASQWVPYLTSLGQMGIIFDQSVCLFINSLTRPSVKMGPASKQVLHL